jgi:hypothetical protein
VDEPDLDAIRSIIYSTPVRSAAGETVGVMEAQFYLFDKQTEIPIGNNTTLVADPSFAKFTVRLLDWRWSGGNSSELSMRIKVIPPFTNFVRRPNWPINTRRPLLSGASSQAPTGKWPRRRYG